MHAAELQASLEDTKNTAQHYVWADVCMQVCVHAKR